MRRWVKAESDHREGILAENKGVFAAPHSSPVAAICVAPGALLIVKDIPARLQRKWGIWSEEGAMFVWTKGAANSYCDTMQFQNGRRIRLHDLWEGQRVEVLSFSGADFPGRFSVDEQRQKSRQGQAGMS